MADRGHELTDEILSSLENRIADEYAVATRDMKRKFREYMEKFKAEDEKQKALLDAGKITKKEYSDWRYRHMMVGKRWEAMKDVLAEDLKHASDIALKISGEKMADVYALNANFATYQIEHDAKIDTGFTLYNHDSAEYLLSDERQLMPGPSTRKAKEIAANKAMQWNKQKIQSAVLQGVLQGEGPHKVAERLRQVGQMDYNASVRYARTMTTSAQNAGRYNSFRRARDLGVELTIEWMATLDSRTRHEHRMMHGQRTTVDEPFHTPDGYTIYYPADCTGESTAPQSEIWNCRCTLRAMVKGYERETIRSSPKMGDMSFEEWQNEKAPKQPQRAYSNEAEYRAAQKAAQEKYNDVKAKLDAEKEKEKDELLDQYGGAFIEQRIQVRNDPLLTEEEKEKRLEEIANKRLEYFDKCGEIDKRYNKRYVDAYHDTHSVYDLDYEFNRIKGEKTLRENIRAVNPGFMELDYGHTHNCQRCGVAFEVRCRGYDVRAMSVDRFGGLGAGAKIDAIFPYAEKVSMKYGGQEATNAVIEQMKQWGDGARAIIGIDRSGGEGHVFNVINDKGNVIFIDAQSDMMWWTQGEKGPIHGGAIMEAMHVDLTRTDNAKLYMIPEGWLEKL